jgi:hypothetical protein
LRLNRARLCSPSGRTPASSWNGSNNKSDENHEHDGNNGNDENDEKDR